MDAETITREATSLFADWYAKRMAEEEIASEDVPEGTGEAWQDRLDFAKEECDSAADEVLMYIAQLTPGEADRKVTLASLCRAIGR